MTTKTTLFPDQVKHFIDEGFTQDEIDSIVADGIFEPLTPEEAYKDNFGVAIEGKPVTGGVKMIYSPTFAQLLLDNREIIFDPKKQRYIKYLSQSGEIDLGCAYIPKGCKAITEGLKDALMFSLRGGIPTGALAGLSHATKALLLNCRYPFVADYDAWVNFGVMQSAIKGAVHCGGKVAIVPEIKDEPKAGAVEFFKSGKTSSDYKKLLDEASTPIEMYKLWVDRQTIDSPAKAAEVAVQASKLLGEIYGYAESPTIAEIKALLKSEKFTEWDLRLADVLRDSHNTQSALKAKERAEDETVGRRAVDICIELIKEDPNVELFHSSDKNKYASIPSSKNGGVKTTYLISSSEFKEWIGGEYYHLTGIALNGDSMNTIIDTIKAIALYDSLELPVSKQRIVIHEGLGYLYLADVNQTVVVYSASGWRVCENPPVKFIYDTKKAPLPIPQHHGDFKKIWDFARIVSLEDRLVVTAVLVKTLVPGGTDPILALAGYQGSGKSNTANVLRSIVDPVVGGKPLTKIPELENLAIHIQQQRVPVIDNLSHITAEQSDTLATVSTGGCITKRTLYTDSGETNLFFQNLIILTSIGNVITKPDLLERSIVIDMLKIIAGELESESNLKLGLQIQHGTILGGLLDITVAALAHRDNTNPPKYNRMVEFTHLGEGVEKYLRCTEGEDKKKYPKCDEGDSLMKRRMMAGIAIANDITIDASPVASTIRDWMKTQKEEWTGTTGDLLNILKPYAKKSELAGTLPKTANTLGGELKKCESALAQYGIIIEDFRELANVDPHRTKKKRIYITPKNSIHFSAPENDLNRSPCSPAPTETASEPSPGNDLSAGEQLLNRSPAVRPQTKCSIENKTLEDIPSNGYECGRTAGGQEGEKKTDLKPPYSDDM